MNHKKLYIGCATLLSERTEHKGAIGRMACFGSKALRKASAPDKQREWRRTPTAKATAQGTGSAHKSANKRKQGNSFQRKNGDSSAGGSGGKATHFKQSSQAENGLQNHTSRKRVDPETIQYFSEISSLLETTTTDAEERAILCANALEESWGKELELACDKRFSRVLENLLISCDKDQLCHFLSRCIKDFPLIAIDQSGSHVAETALRSLALALQACDVQAESHAVIEQVLTKICQEVAENVMDVMSNQYGSHVLRSLLCLCSGTLLESQDKFHSSNSVSTLAGRFGGLRFQLDRKQSGQAPLRAFPSLLKFTISKILECLRENIASMRMDTSAGLVLQTILKLLEGDDEAEIQVITALLECSGKTILNEGKILEGAPVQNVINLMKEPASSHLMEVILEVAPDSLYMEIFNRFFRHSLFEIASHKCGNFVVQSLISASRHQGQVNMIWEELGSKFEELLKGRKPGVVASLIAACCRFHTHERECCRALAHAVNPGSASPNCIVPHILFLENYSCTAGRSDWQWPSGNKMSVLGCLMLQSIFKYPNELIQQFCSSFASMEVNHILEAAKDPGGGRVIEAFLSSNAPLKHKHRVISKFRGHFGELAQQPASSFTVAKCFSAADVALKEVITSELSQIQVELSRTKHGPHLLKSCDVARYSKGPDQWRSSQSLKQSTRQAFAEAFGSQVEAKREDDCGGLVPCNEEASDIPNKRSKNRKRERELHKGEHEMVNSVLSKEDVSKLEHSMAELGFAMHKHGKTVDVNGKAGMNVGQSEKHKDKMAGKQKSLSNREFKKNSEKDAIEEIFGRKDKVKKANKGREMHKAHDKLADAEPVVQKIIDPAVQSVLRSIEKGTKKKKRPAIDDPSAFNAKNQKQRRQMVYI